MLLSQMKTLKDLMEEIAYLSEDYLKLYYTREFVKYNRHIELIIKEVREYIGMSTEEAAKQMVGFLKEGLDVMASIKALYGAKFDPDIVNKMMDDFGERYNSSPLEYQDNLAINRQDLVEKLENLYKGAE